MINNATKNVVVFRFDVDDEEIFGGNQRTTIRETVSKWYSSIDFDLDPFALTVKQEPNVMTSKVMVAVIAKMTEIEEFAYRLKYPTSHLVDT